MNYCVFGRERSVLSVTSACFERAACAPHWLNVLLALIVGLWWCSVACADVLNVDLSSATVAGQVPITSQFLPDVGWINFYVDGSEAGSINGSAGGFNWNSASVGDGIHDIVAIGYDAGGIVSGYSDIRLNAANYSPSRAPGTVPIYGYADQYIGWINLYIDNSYVQSTGGSSWGLSPSFTAGTHNIRVAGYGSGPVLMAAAQVSSVNFGGGGGSGGGGGGSASASAGTGPAPTYFPTIPPGQALPSEAQCASWVLSIPSNEPTPSNAPYNQTAATAAELSSMMQEPSWNNLAPASAFQNVTGDFTSGTTTQILRWSACKWGLDENYIKADAYWQSTNSSGSVIWDQSTIWDWRSDYSECVTPGWDGWGMFSNGSTGSTQGCYQSYGIHQLKPVDWNIWPEVRDSTSFNTDFYGAMMRGCMSGEAANYISNDSGSDHSVQYPASTANQTLLGCIGMNASGHWYDSGATAYIGIIQNLLSYTPWPAT